VAIGDLHGDLAAARAALRLAGAIDERDLWIGGPLVVVQTGDVLDRGDDERALLAWLDRVAAAARAAGGALHRLVGNHEVLNVQGISATSPRPDWPPSRTRAPTATTIPAWRASPSRPGGEPARSCPGVPSRAVSPNSPWCSSSATACSCTGASARRTFATGSRASSGRLARS
jgi:hypothetical protein